MPRPPFPRLGPMAVCMLFAAPAAALTFTFPGPAETTAVRREKLSSHVLPTGPWVAGTLPSRVIEGALDQTAWRIKAPGLTTLELLAPLRDQLIADGFTLLWDCETAACGGFDFRYAIDVLPEPDMHVDLGDFRFLAAERAGPAPEVVSLIVSRSAAHGFVQVTRIGPPETAGPLPEPAPSGQPAPDATVPVSGRLGAALEISGSAALDDLAFETGSAQLAAGDFASLTALAEYLRANPGRQVTLVGHTDASGGLDGNVALSRARAESVRARLIEAFGIPPGQVSAEGVGYLAPRSTNLTEAGRTSNRRVEVMLTSTQ